jgi:hypothetical protein
MNIVTIKEVKGVVTCADNGTAEHVFNVKNATDKALKVGMQLSMDEPTSAEWLQIDGSTEHELDVETMTQVSAKIQVPSDCAPGKYSYRLRVYDPANPGEIYTDGEPVYFEVPVREEKTEVQEINGKQPFKWWIPVAIAVGVIVVGVVVWAVWPQGLKLPDFTRMDLAGAEQFLKDNNITYDKQIQLKPKSRAEILSQQPDPDTKIKDEDKVTLIIAGAKVPGVVRLPLSAALGKIIASGLTIDLEKHLHEKTVSRASEIEKIQTQKPKPNSLVPIKSSMELWVGKKKLGQKLSLSETKAISAIVKTQPKKSVTGFSRLSTRWVEPAPE